MRVHIDWLSFTVRPVYLSEHEGSVADAVIEGLNYLLGRELYAGVIPTDFALRERSRAPYNVAWESKGASITVFASATLDHFTVEISGQGCEIIHHNELMNELLTAVHDHVTRIDIACDIETSTKPGEFVALKSHERMRASGSQRSETGETEYVGSQKSDRYARIYRYNEPHPRSHLLRIEHVFRRDHAKVVSRECSSGGLRDIAYNAGNAFGWMHPDWQPKTSNHIDLSPVSGDRKGNNTLFWMVNTVAPAFRRLAKNGVISDPLQFLTNYFLTEL